MSANRWTAKRKVAVLSQGAELRVALVVTPDLGTPLRADLLRRFVRFFAMGASATASARRCNRNIWRDRPTIPQATTDG
jgi:hypothetical protein